MIFDTYMSRLLPNCKCNALYLRPKANYSQDWYIDTPVGINRLQSAVRELCQEAGLSGYFINHSLRATAATCMYNNVVKEQMISEVTGHRLLCVRSFKKSSITQKCHSSHSMYNPNRYSPYTLHVNVARPVKFQ